MTHFRITNTSAPLIGPRHFSVYINVDPWREQMLPNVLDNWSQLLGYEDGRLDGHHAVFVGKHPALSKIAHAESLRSMCQQVTDRGMTKRIKLFGDTPDSSRDLEGQLPASLDRWTSEAIHMLDHLGWKDGDYVGFGNEPDSAKFLDPDDREEWPQLAAEFVGKILSDRPEWKVGGGDFASQYGTPFEMLEDWLKACASNQVRPDWVAIHNYGGQRNLAEIASPVERMKPIWRAAFPDAEYPEWINGETNISVHSRQRPYPKAWREENGVATACGIIADHKGGFCETDFFFHQAGRAPEGGSMGMFDSNADPLPAAEVGHGYLAKMQQSADHAVEVERRLAAEMEWNLQCYAVRAGDTLRVLVANTGATRPVARRSKSLRIWADRHGLGRRDETVLRRIAEAEQRWEKDTVDVLVEFDGLTVDGVTPFLPRVRGAEAPRKITRNKARFSLPPSSMGVFEISLLGASADKPVSTKRVRELVRIYTQTGQHDTATCLRQLLRLSEQTHGKQ